MSLSGASWGCPVGDAQAERLACESGYDPQRCPRTFSVFGELHEAIHGRPSRCWQRAAEPWHSHTASQQKGVGQLRRTREKGGRANQKRGGGVRLQPFTALELRILRERVVSNPVISTSSLFATPPRTMVWDVKHPTSAMTSRRRLVTLSH